LQPKSQKCIFVGYSEDFKGYRLLQTHCNEIIIRRDVEFDENLLAYEHNSACVCNIPDIKSMQNRNKMLEMAE
jgi:hypothetical protein